MKALAIPILIIQMIFFIPKTVDGQPSICSVKYQDILDKTYQRAEMYIRLMELYASATEYEEQEKYKQSILQLFADKESKIIVDDISIYSISANENRSINDYLFILPDHLPPEETKVSYHLKKPSEIIFDEKDSLYYSTIKTDKVIQKHSSSITAERLIVIEISDIENYSPKFNIYRIINNVDHKELPGTVVAKQQCGEVLSDSKLPEDEEPNVDLVITGATNFPEFTFSNNSMVRGKSNLIQWEGGPSTIELKLFQNGKENEPGNYKNIVSDYKNDGAYQWEIPTNLKPGNYHLVMRNDGSDLIISKSFSIRRKIPLVIKIAVPVSVAGYLLLADKNNWFPFKETDKRIDFEPVVPNR